MHAIAMELIFQLTAKARALQALSQEVPLQLLILHMLPDVRETQLAIVQHVDDFLQNLL
jgi:hypothetical protein